MKILACLLVSASCCLAMTPVLSQKKENVTSKTVAAENDLSAAVLVLAPGMSGPEKKAVQMLVEEIEKRSNVRWQISAEPVTKGKPAVYIGQRSALVSAFPELADKLKTSDGQKAEGYRILSFGPGRAIIAGNDARGVLFGAGRMLRLLNYTRSVVTLSATTDVETAPKYALRGHQLGYRPKTNSYDGWSVAMWEQYIRDLVIFGANAIELIPPVSDDDADSPHFPLPPMKMMIEMSRIASEYGIECWIWYPAMEKDYGDAATVTKAIKEWGDVIRQLPRVDAVFVPGGDPGHTAPKDLFPMIEKQTVQLKKLHPAAKMWMSPQGFNAEWMDDFYRILKTQPSWLEGIVFGPQQRESLDDLSTRIPKQYKIRFYPDITHSLRAQYPVPDWDYAYQVTLNREPINPRPTDEAGIFRRLQPLAPSGFLTYSEGCNDDVNKFVWSGLGWDPDEDVTDILRDYSHYFIGGPHAESFAQGLLALERNWRGPLAVNENVLTTLNQFRELEKAANPSLLQNWRFQQALYRAYYDATDRSRLLSEAAQEEKAMACLRKASATGSLNAVSAAESALAKPETIPAADLRSRVFELAEALFQSIHMQLSVPRYQAIAIGRGANLDLIDFPLNNVNWLNTRFAAVRAAATETERLHLIDSILNWTNPGAGGYYDDLGNPLLQPHLVKGSDYKDDPAFLLAPMVGNGARLINNTARISSATFAESLHERPLEMQYRSLDKSARYRVKIVYGAEARADIKLVANGKYEIHGMRAKPMTLQPEEFDVPAEATETGELRLTWTRPTGLGGSGRGVQVAEVWLIRVHDIVTSERTSPYMH